MKWLERPSTYVAMGVVFTVPHLITLPPAISEGRWILATYSAVCAGGFAGIYVWFYRRAKQRIVDQCIDRLTRGTRKCVDPNCCHELSCCPDCPEARP
jgi:hypothetical protein